MKRALAIVVAVGLAALVVGAAVAQMGETPQAPMGPGQMPGQMGMMMRMMAQMQERMGSMMGTMAQMRQMMLQRQAEMEQLCPGAMK